MAQVIRGASAASKASFSFGDLQRQGDALLQQARVQAAQILAAARAQAERDAAQLRAEAQQRGREEGLAAGREAGRAEALRQALQEHRAALEKLGEGLRLALGQFDGMKRRLLGEAESGLVELALAVAQRVCKRLPSSDPQVVLESCRAVLELAQFEHDLELRIHPREAELLAASLPVLVAELGALAHARIVPDEAVSAGGCVLTSREGTIDARIETQLERLATSLLGEEAAS